MNENRRKAVEAFFHEKKKNEKSEENCQGIWYIPFHCLRQNQQNKD